MVRSCESEGISWDAIDFNSNSRQLTGTAGIVCLGLSTPDLRCFTYFSGWYVTVMTIYADACPEKLRVAVGKLGSVVLLVWLLLCCSAIYRDAVPDSQVQFITIGKTVYNTLDLALIGVANYCVFLPNHIYNVTSAPENYIILRARMKSIKVKAREASILTTVQKRLDLSKKKKGSRPAGSLSPFRRTKRKEKKSNDSSDLDSSIASSKFSESGRSEEGSEVTSKSDAEENK